jgi:transposase-like protein
MRHSLWLHCSGERIFEWAQLSVELGIHRTQLYKWREQVEAAEDGPGPAATSRERGWRKEIRELQHLLVEKPLKVDFFKGAL